MSNTSRRDAFKLLLAGASIPALPAVAAATATTTAVTAPTWRRGIEGQRQADQGDGTYLNPVIAGDHPDPTVLKDGKDYYLTYSSFYSYPGLVIWHSTDLVNWRPLAPALSKPLGTIWAVDLCKHDGRYFIYIPAAPDGKPWSIYAIWADHIEGRWSDPVDLKIPDCIDPGHVVGEDGKRYLFVNGIRKIRLTDDGLATDGKLEKAYEPWRYPADWVVENFAPEGPKLLRRGKWFYLLTAVGGTAGPVTGHMVIAARSASIHGPWEHCPHNPLVRSMSTAEPWWSRGHATLVEGPAGHALSDDFKRNRFGVQWAFHDPAPDEMARARYVERGLRIAARGTSPADSRPLTCTVGDRTYEVEIALTLEGDAEAGLLLFYSQKAFVGIGFSRDEVKTFQYAEEQGWARSKRSTSSVIIRMTNDDHVVTWRYSHDGGKSWTLHGTRMEVSGIHHNVFGGFLSLKAGIYCAGDGAVTLGDFRYRALAS